MENVFPWSQYQKRYCTFGNVLRWPHLVPGLEDETPDQKFIFLSALARKLCSYFPRIS